MKKIYMILAAALVMSAANSCDKANVSQDNFSVEPMVVNFTAKVADTKTVFKPVSFVNGASVPVLWTGNEEIDIYVNEETLSGLVPEIPVQIEGEVPSATASWSYDFSKTYNGTFSDGYVPEAPFTFYAFCPGKNTRAFFNAGKQRILVDGIPAEQTPGENSCDEAAMMVCSISQEYDLWPEEVEMPPFKHMTAYGCITLGSGAPTEGIKKVSVTANAGQYLAGTAWYYYAGDKEGEWGNYSNPGTETININTESSENIWFGCRPTAELSSLTFEVFTEAGETYKVVKDLTGKNLKFTAGKVAMMTINGFEKVQREEGSVSYTLNSTALHGMIGGTYSPGATEKSGVYGKDGEPGLTFASVATLAGDVNVTNPSGRLKFGKGTEAIMSEFSIVITPEEGWIVKSITVNSKVASNIKYSLVANVGDNVLINVGELTTTDTDYTNETENEVAGPVNVTFHGSTTGVFYISSISVTLASAE